MEAAAVSQSPARGSLGGGVLGGAHDHSRPEARCGTRARRGNGFGRTPSPCGLAPPPAYSSRGSNCIGGESVLVRERL